MMVMLAGCPPVIGHFVPDDNGGGMTLWLTFNCYFHKNSLVRAFSDDSEQSLYSTKKRTQACILFAGAINHRELEIGFRCRFGI
jgi:hypothetical protein